MFTETDKAILKSLPQSIDWRTKGYVPAIKSQQSCGSCWAFGAISSLEGQYYNLTGKLLRLSEQNLVDCTYRSINHNGCEGGFPHEAFDNMQKFGNGVNVESSYPYTAQVNFIINLIHYFQTALFPNSMLVHAAIKLLQQMLK